MNATLMLIFINGAEVNEQVKPAEAPAVTPAPNDNIISLEELGRQILTYHEKAEDNEKEASVNVWESGTRLNQAYDRVHTKDGYGGWGEYLAKNCPKMPRTKVWRNRKVATCFTLEQVQGKTLTELYAAMKVARFEEEPVAEPVTNAQPASTTPKPQSLASAFPAFTKAWEKLDIPETLSMQEKAAVKRVCAKLESAYDRIEKPSILRINWEAKLVEGVTTWTEADRILFKADFARMQAIYDDLKALAETM
jgi:hypothetical protein